MTRVGIIGASGMAGREIYKLAEQNPELDVMGIVRDEAKARQILGSHANLLSGNIFSLTDSVLAKFDVIIDAFGTSPDQAEQQVKLAKKLVNLARKNKIKLIFILGAGSLRTGEDQHLFVEDITKLPDADQWINTPRQQLAELRYLEQVTDVDWLGISPSAIFKPGPAHNYRLGKDMLLFDEQGESQVTTGTMAQLVINEVITPTHHQERITIINQ